MQRLMFRSWIYVVKDLWSSLNNDVTVKKKSVMGMKMQTCEYR